MSENCKSLALQDKCNIEIFLSPDMYVTASTQSLATISPQNGVLLARWWSAFRYQIRGKVSGASVDVYSLMAIEKVKFKNRILFCLLQSSSAYLVYSTVNGPLCCKTIGTMDVMWI